ncbi:glycerophosphodiester phosphodiesterase family protein [Brevundimonas sp.]|uniref:glycerophosphodiester phosphodiesterase family protein n=1 Tax=Brevundimonas sp. TaxID=1871086 RepID=UPI002D660968|nr:glycerophosphodiester phosphodiesterase family protein [Brevundimonas sp.]HYC98569.1 glycerophosphodiester phosphodiesterase family protein [Brevundimonas sp.]
MTRRTAPLIIAHRGASGERPEHTRAAYELAVDQGADLIEPDLVMTRDGALVVRHENEIGGTTDVADHPEFADRRAAKTIDGWTTEGWFTEDFTLAELKTLRARERLPALRPANTAFDGREPVLTFDEVLEIARAGSARTGRVIGVAPELKHPSYFAAAGLPMEDAFVAALERRGLTGTEAAVLVQCFEVGTLRRLRARIDAPLLQLVAAGGGPADRPDLTWAAMCTPEGLAEVAVYADWIGADTALIEPRPGKASALIADAHAAGLKVAGWTFRAENLFLPEIDRIGGDPAAHGRLRERLARFAGHGLDAAFMDQPGLARE